MMTERAATPAQMVAGLIAKRAEIAAGVEGLQRQVKKAVSDLDRVEATIRLFQPDIDLTTLPARPVPPIHGAVKGEVTQIIFEALRAAKRPIRTTDLTEALMKRRGLSVDDLRLRRTMLQRVGAMLNHWKRVKRFLKSPPGTGQMLMWEIDKDRIAQRRSSAIS
jgi:hypothetical protein